MPYCICYNKDKCEECVFINNLNNKRIKLENERIKSKLCSNCNENCENIIYKNYKKYIFTILRVSPCPDINKLVLSYLFHINGHIVTHQIKSSRQPTFLKYEIVNELGGYFWYPKNLFCSKCFQYGIYECMKELNRLPYLRTDYNIFFKYKNKIITKKDLENVLNTMNLEYFLPNNYIISYYRQRKPKKFKKYNYILKMGKNF